MEGVRGGMGGGPAVRNGKMDADADDDDDDEVGAGLLNGNLLLLDIQTELVAGISQ